MMFKGGDTQLRRGFGTRIAARGRYGALLKDTKEDTGPLGDDALATRVRHLANEVLDEQTQQKHGDDYGDPRNKSAGMRESRSRIQYHWFV